MPSSTTFTEYFCVRRKFLLYNLIMRNLKIRYRKSLLGMLWTVLIPAGTACIYFVIFNFVFKVKVPNYLLLILSGLIPWTFFVTTITLGVESLVNNYSLLNKVPLPPQALPMSEALTHLLNLVLSFPVILVAMIILRVAPTWAALQYPILIAILALITYAAALMLAVLYVYFRDLKHIVTLVLQFWLYLTPVMYSVTMIPERFRFVLMLNPIGTVFAGFHTSLVDGQFIACEDWLTMLGWLLFLTLLSKFMLGYLRNSIIEML